MKTLVRFTSLNNKKFPSLRYPFPQLVLLLVYKLKGRVTIRKVRHCFSLIIKTEKSSNFHQKCIILFENPITYRFSDGKISYNQLVFWRKDFLQSAFNPNYTVQDNFISFPFHNINIDISHLQSSGLTFISSQSLKRIWSFTQHRTVTSSKPHERKGNVKLTRDLKFP